jgi:hypothetical protein
MKKTGNRTTEEWLKKHPTWHDSDMIKSLAVGIAIGIGISLLVGMFVCGA